LTKKRVISFIRHKCNSLQPVPCIAFCHVIAECFHFLLLCRWQLRLPVKIIGCFVRIDVIAMTQLWWCTLFCLRWARQLVLNQAVLVPECEWLQLRGCRRQREKKQNVKGSMKNFNGSLKLVVNSRFFYTNENRWMVTLAVISFNLVVGCFVCQQDYSQSYGW